MNLKAVFFIVMSWLLTGCSSTVDEPITFFRVQTPRPFGYVIGDEIKQRILIDTRQGLVLDKNSILAKGPVNRWLNLNNINIVQSKANTGIHYQIDLTYQLFYAPLEVKMLELPGFSLQFRQYGKTLEQKVPGWFFTSAPLRELAIRKEDGKEYMRPDTSAPLLDNSTTLIRLYCFLLIAVALAVYLAWLYGLLGFFPKYQIFRRPARRLDRLSDNELIKMLSIIHNALNQLNGKPLFQHKLADFYQRFPDYRQLDAELNWFFNVSNQCFFTTKQQASDSIADKIRALCRHCLQIERGMR